jgi:hypothetical protein
MKTAFLSAVAFLTLSLSSPAVEPAGFPVRDGDQPIVFIGDSITEQKQYTTLIETYLLTRFPDWKLTFRNSGWSGDRMTLSLRGGPEAGFKRDILPLKPAFALINFGMNDARAGTSNIPAYAQAAQQLVSSLTNAGSRVVLLTPSPEERYEEGQPGGSAYNILFRSRRASRSSTSSSPLSPASNPAAKPVSWAPPTRPA